MPKAGSNHHWGDTALRECRVLIAGVALSFAVSWMGNAGRNIVFLAAAVLVPIGFCVARAALLDGLPPTVPALRRIFAQLVTAAALVVLLVFEMGVAMLAGAAGIPADVWVFLGAVATAYVGLMISADVVGGRSLKASDR